MPRHSHVQVLPRHTLQAPLHHTTAHAKSVQVPKKHTTIINTYLPTLFPLLEYDQHGADDIHRVRGEDAPLCVGDGEGCGDVYEHIVAERERGAVG